MKKLFQKILFLTSLATVLSSAALSQTDRDLYQLLDLNLQKMFPEYGKYDLTFAIPYSDDKDNKQKEFFINSFSINIAEPTGVDKEAFDFLSKYDNSRFLTGLVQENNSEALLDSFSEKFGQTVYGDYAIENLASFYLNSGDLNKAEIKYEKIKSSANPIIADRAKGRLREIKRKKEYLEKLNQLRRPR